MTIERNANAGPGRQARTPPEPGTDAPVAPRLRRDERQRATPQPDGRRTTLTVPPGLDGTVSLLTQAAGLSPNAALIHLATLGAEQYRREHERRELSARRHDIVRAIHDGPGTGVFPTDEELDDLFGDE